MDPDYKAASEILRRQRDQLAQSFQDCQLNLELANIRIAALEKELAEAKTPPEPAPAPTP